MTGRLTFSNVSGNSIIRANNSTKDTSCGISVYDTWVDDSMGIALSVGTGGYNRGIYDIYENAWMLYKNSAGKIYVGGVTTYFVPGDTATFLYYGSGYVTNGGTEVHFTVTLGKPFYNISGISITSMGACTIRQGGNYCYGSSSTSTVTPPTRTITGYIAGSGILHVVLSFNNTTNVTNNSSIALAVATTTVTFS